MRSFCRCDIAPVGAVAADWKLTPRSVAAFCRIGSVVAFADTKNVPAPSGPFASHETSSPAASKRLTATKLCVFSWLK